MSAPFEVPTVDISSYVGNGSPDERAATAAAMDVACRTVGFVQVVGHGVPDDTLAGLAGAIDDFFALPLEVKRGYVAPKGINRGYTPPKSESLSLSLGVEAADRMNDFFEAFNTGAAVSDYPGVELDPAMYPEDIWPAEDLVPAFRERVQAWEAEAGRVARTLTTVFADALGLAPGWFDQVTRHSLDVVRMNNYALPPGQVELDGDLTGMGEHTDYGIVTVLWADQVAGLQVLDTDGTWHDVAPADGALLVNLGDAMARWTNERWMSTLHRVKPPVIDGTIQRRRSSAFFHDGDVDAVISALPNCVAAGEEPLYPPITLGEHIAAKLAGSRAGRANTAAQREAARVLSSAR
jgi:isopenicillin N synthase-like dioxygenase